ncbi:MAG: sigma-70 family RNA polymerase sigma factor [Saprospiraceae bacterium]|nr:sigma-70 family RNA polymerase sigma factor [Saprospiraceae bacterium]
MQTENNLFKQIDVFKNKLFRYALNMLKNELDAEDVIQELLIKLATKEQFDQIENKEAWCMTVTRNLCIDKIRARKQSSQDISEYHFIADHGATPDIVTEDRENLKIVMDVLNALPENQKEIIHLRDVEGYTYKEIADLIGLSEDQVKVNLFRARQRLKEKLKNFKY